MKSRVKAYSKKDIEWMCDEVMEDVEKCVQANGAVFIIALIRHTGWGQKRMNDFLKTFNATMQEYHQHTTDDVFDYMAAQELASAGIEMQQLKPPHIPFKQQLRKHQVEETVDVSYTTAKQLHGEMIAAGNYVKLKEGAENANL